MKKFLLSLAMAITAIGASAQNTYNVRTGGAVLNEYAAFTIMAQANISLNNYGTWTFSPAVQLATNVDDTAAMLHANMGSRTRITLNPQLHSRSATYKRNGLLIRKTAIKSSRPFQCAYYPLTP